MKRCNAIEQLGATILILLSTSCQAIAHTVPAECDGSSKSPCIVQDTYHSSVAVKNFRTTTMIYDQYQGDRTGLKSLHVSGSAAISKNGFTQILKHIKSNSSLLTSIIDLDLREESHAYINGNSYTLMTNDDWINLGKSYNETLAAEANWINTLKNYQTIPGVLTTSQFKSQQYQNGKSVSVVRISNEEMVAHSLGLKYIRLAITDHMAPRDEEVDKFVKLLQNLNTNTWLHIHCRGGEGRTTTFLAMYDIFTNADRVTFDEIIHRQASVAPFYDLANIKRTNPIYTPLYEQRYAFLKVFYSYARAVRNGYSGTWSEWNNEIAPPR